MTTNDNETNPPTPLLALLRVMTDPQRDTFAALAGTSTNYLYQVATCARRTPSARWCLAVEDASAEMHRRSRGKLPKVTTRQLAEMCAVVAPTAA